MPESTTHAWSFKSS